ncbi:hypothetical protein NXS19_001456 [Fusarium pseudograminearum]|nr:hypothetical protein NXS19_001456 [Fusarium pseudograminearum]
MAFSYNHTVVSIYQYRDNPQSSKASASDTPSGGIWQHHINHPNKPRTSTPVSQKFNETMLGFEAETLHLDVSVVAGSSHRETIGYYHCGPLSLLRSAHRGILRPASLFYTSLENYHEQGNYVYGSLLFIGEAFLESNLQVPLGVACSWFLNGSRHPVTVCS